MTSHTMPYTKRLRSWPSFRDFQMSIFKNLEHKSTEKLLSFYFITFLSINRACSASSLACSPSHGGDVAVYVSDINQPILPTAFYSVLVSISVFMAFSTVFHSINSPHNFPLSHSVLAVLFLFNWSFQLYISLRKSPSALI